MARFAVRRRGVLLVAAALVLLVLTWLADAALEQAGDGAPSAGNTAPSAGDATASRGGATEMRKSAPTTTVPVPPGTEPVPTPVDVSAERTVVRNARLALTVSDIPAVSGTVRDATLAAGGFVANERSVERSSTFTLRVPTSRLDEVLTRIAGTGKVTERSEQADDVTDQVVDLEGRLATQRASVARVRGLLDRASTVGEVVSIESELTAREAELESLQRRLASVAGRAALSTLSVTLSPVPAPGADLAADDTGFLAGLASGWRAFTSAGVGLLTVLGVVLPFLLLIALLVPAGLAGRRTLRRRRQAPASE